MSKSGNSPRCRSRRACDPAGRPPGDQPAPPSLRPAVAAAQGRSVILVEGAAPPRRATTRRDNPSTTWSPGCGSMGSPRLMRSPLVREPRRGVLAAGARDGPRRDGPARACRHDGTELPMSDGQAYHRQAGSGTPEQIASALRRSPQPKQDLDELVEDDVVRDAGAGGTRAGCG